MFDPVTMSDASLQAEIVDLARTMERVQAAFIARLAEWDGRGVWMTARGASPRSFLTLTTGMAKAEAGSHVALARSLRLAPLTADALADGHLNVAKARLIAALAANPRTRERFIADEGELVAWCVPLSVEEAAIVARTWLAQADADGPNPPSQQRRSLRLVDLMDGRVRVEGELDAEGGHIVRNVLQGVADTLRRSLPDGAAKPSRLQLWGDALVEACRRATAADDWSPSAPAVLNVQVDLATMEGRAGRPAMLDGDGVLSSEALRRLACDAEVHGFVTGDNDRILHMGRVTRTATPAQRRYLAQRDRGCRFPGCGAQPGWCQAHHIVTWDSFGFTDVENMVLLCHRHHHAVHEGGWQLERLPDQTMTITSPIGDIETLPEAVSPWPQPAPPPDIRGQDPGPSRQYIRQRLDELRELAGRQVA